MTEKKGVKNISLLIFGEQAKTIEKRLRLEYVGDITDVNTKIIFEKMTAKGRSKIKIEFDL